MYKMYKKDRSQWVEVAAFENWSQARYYARRMGFRNVDNDDECNYYYYKDCFEYDDCLLNVSLTEEELDAIKNDDYDVQERYNVRVCHNCGRIIGLNTNSDYVEIDDEYYCNSDCAISYGYEWCENCESWQPAEEIFRTHNGRRICQNCYDEDYFTCDNCGDIYHNDDMFSDEWGDYCYCPNCWEEEHSGIIKEYHCGNRVGIQRTKEDTPQTATFGTEIEAECFGSSREEVAEQVNEIVNKDRELFAFEEDGSLSDEGYETISPPFTMRWFKENKEMFEKMYKKMVSMGCRSHDTSTCGFHVHVGRQFFEKEETSCIDKLVYLFEKYRLQLEVFSRRRNFGWCQFPSDVANEGVEWSKLDEVKKLDKYHFRGHHSAINLENYSTIEIRIFRGTLNFNTYCATLEFVNNLIHYVKDKSDKEIEEGSFRDILDYLPTEYLMQYCLERNII